MRIKTPTLVADWKSAWRWYCVHALALAGAIPAAWAALPPTWHAAVPAWAMSVLVIATAICGVIGRVIDQDGNSREMDS